jgi:Xaa-Pro aminopeptidase
MIAIAEECAARRAAFAASLAATKVTAAIVADQLNFAYFTGVFSREFDKRSRHLVLLVAAEGAAVALVPESAVQAMRRKAPNLSVLAFRDGPTSAEILAEGLRAVGFADGRLGAECSGADRPCLPRALGDDLLRRSGVLRYEDVNPALAALRSIKSEGEIASIRHAGTLAQRAWEKSITTWRVGLTVDEAARILAANFAMLGADYYPAGHIEMRNVTRPDSGVILAGDILWCDFGVCLGGYQSDLSRRAVFGAPSATQLDHHAFGAQLLATTITNLLPGRSLSSIFAALAEARRQRPVEADNTRRFGHGIGLCAAEAPSIADDDASELRPGMVLTPEPSFVAVDGEFVHLEEMAAVRPTGPERLSFGAEILYRVG